MRRVAGLVTLGFLLGSCARPQAVPHPAPTPVASTPPAKPDTTRKSLPDQVVKSLTTDAPSTPVKPQGAPSKTDTTAQNAALSFDRKAAKDSLADAAALAALANTAALSSLPELPIGDMPNLDLNEASFANQPRVQFYIDYFTGYSRDRFQVWLQRLPRYESLVRGNMADKKLPGDLIYLALIESGYSPTAVSSATAVGMWQFMAGTGMKYGLRVDGWVDERRDPVKSTDAAARHLRDLTDEFGSYYLAAAAYNAGAGKVERGLTKMGGASAVAAADSDVDLTDGTAFFSLASTRMLVKETKDYVPKLIAATMIAKSPQRYGFEPVAPVAPFPLDSVMVEGGTGLDLMARLADTTLDAMRELNPNLLRLVAPPGTASYPIRVPAGKAAMVAERYAAVQPDERYALVVYKARAGETVTTIAAKTGSSAEDLRTVNRTARLGKITAGTVLYIPHTTIPLSLLRDAGSSTLTTTHIVKSGENLGGIARKYGVTVASIRSANGLTAKSSIRVGQRLNVAAPLIAGVGPGAAPAPRNSSSTAASKTPPPRSTSVAAKPAPAPASSTATKMHVVKAGETLSGIAIMYGVNQARLASINGLSGGKKIVVGQKLKIPA